MSRLLLLGVADAARSLGRTPACIPALARAGRLGIAATTPRGTRLFRMKEVEAVKRQREARAR